MVETPQSNHDGAEARNQGAGMGAPEAKLWFVREVLPLEAALMQFLRHNWRNESDLVDIRQDVCFLQGKRIAVTWRPKPVKTAICDPMNIACQQKSRDAQVS